MAHDEANKDVIKSAAGIKGGHARAEVLSPDERREIASRAAAARWGSPNEPLPEVLCGSPDRPLRLGNVEIPCYVLGDGRRVLVQAGMMKALDISQGTAGRVGGDRIARLAATKSIAPFVSNDLAKMIINPIRFRTPHGGGLAYGYEATALADLCDAVLAARKEGRLNYQQAHIAEQCEMLVRSFAKVGIIALVDEATGYQDMRARNALAKIFEQFIAKELQRYVSTFPLDYYRELFRLRGWSFDAESIKRPRLVGQLTNNLIYRRLAPGVLDELRRVTERDQKGRLKTKLFQRLTVDIGHPKLKEHLAAVVALMRASSDWSAFMKAMDRALPKYPRKMNPDQLALNGGGF